MALIARFIGDPEWVWHRGEASRQRVLMLYDKQKVVALQPEHVARMAPLCGLL